MIVRGSTGGMPWYGGKQIKTLPISLSLDPERVKRFCEVHVIPGAVFALCLQVPHPLQSVQLKAWGSAGEHGAAKPHVMAESKRGDLLAGDISNLRSRGGSGMALGSSYEQMKSAGDLPPRGLLVIMSHIIPRTLFARSEHLGKSPIELQAANVSIPPMRQNLGMASHASASAFSALVPAPASTAA